MQVGLYAQFAPVFQPAWRGTNIGDTHSGGSTGMSTFPSSSSSSSAQHQSKSWEEIGRSVSGVTSGIGMHSNHTSFQ